MPWATETTTGRKPAEVPDAHTRGRPRAGACLAVWRHGGDPAGRHRLAARVTRADGPLARARGLLGRAGLEPDQGLWLAPCRQVHTCFMRFAIDVVFLDRQGRVLRLCRELPPWRLSPWVWGAASALELAAGVAGPLRPGDRLEFVSEEASR